MGNLKVTICDGYDAVEYVFERDGVVSDRFYIGQEDPYSDMVEVFKAAGIRDVEYEEIV